MTKQDNVVQPSQWWQVLPRPQWRELPRVQVKSDWFEVYQLLHQIFAIYEPHHFQEVMSFLVIGSTKAMLVDTGMGIKNIKAVVEELTDLPLVVVNTHTHFDHIGDNWRFDLVHVLDEPSAKERLSQTFDVGQDILELKDNFIPEAFHYDKMETIDLDNFQIKPCRFKTIKEGHVFDLGNRQFRVVATPGHSPDSIMLVCDEEKLVFVGDTFYPASLYAHFYGSFETYRQTLHRVATEFSDYQLFCSHNEALRPGRSLAEAAKAFDQIASGEARFVSDESGLKKYQFDDFAVIV